MVKLALALAVCASAKQCKLPPGTEGADDGNPHCWDRLRRCDGPNAHPDDGPGYTPQCGLCEGIGGNVWGDRNNQISIPACRALARADNVTDKPPVPEWAWGNGGRFTVEDDKFLMIGKKQDPFCFNFVPSNNASGAQCYRRQTGKIYVDMTENVKALRYDLNMHIPWPSDRFSLFGNISASILHQGGNMWIVNNLYNLMNMCVCTKVCTTNPCPPPPFPAEYPVMYNWTKHLNYLGREEMDIEYGIGKMEVEHWNYGPHHAWTKKGDNKILRMWQPYNQFSVYTPGSWKDGVADPAVFASPPALCKKGGALARISCGDDGYPTDAEAAASDASPFQPPTLPATSSDLRRARTKVPGSNHRGPHFQGMASKLNGALRAYGNVKACSEWTTAELRRLQALLFLFRDSALHESYAAASDRRALRDSALRWQSSLASGLGEAHQQMQRDGHCHEAVMWFVHHLSEDARAMVAAQTPVPLLPTSKHECPESSHPEAAEVCEEYIHQVSCLDCHVDATAPEVLV